jgi:hypothetical protein
MYLKVINFIAFYQIFIIFHFSIGNNYRFYSLIIFTILCITPEIRSYLFSTNLDAVFGFLILSEFYIFNKIISNKIPYESNLILIIVLAAFSGGQKHFGLMFSFPIIVVSSLYYYFHNKYSIFKM